MENLKRCPFCYRLPIFTFTPYGMWEGGCQSQGPVCSALGNAVLQTDLEQAIAQWANVIEPFVKALAMVA